MDRVVIFIIGLFVGGIAGIIKCLKNEISNIAIEEYVTNTGKKAYRIFKKDKVYDENTKRYIEVENYLGEVVENNYSFKNEP